MKHSAAASYLEFVKGKPGEQFHSVHKGMKSVVPLAAMKAGYSRLKQPQASGPSSSKPGYTTGAGPNAKAVGNTSTNRLSNGSSSPQVDEHRTEGEHRGPRFGTNWG
jgi:hypothetical protein